MDAAELAPRLKALRQERRYSLQDVADGTGLSKSFLSLVEKGGSDISIGRLVRLVKFYGVTITDLLSEPSPNPAVVTKSQRRCVPSPQEGIDVFFLTPNSERKMLPLLVRIEPGGQSKEPVTHDGEEFVHVKKGGVAVEVGDETLLLNEGDSVYFNAESPHSYRNVNSTAAELFLVVTPPSL